MDIISHLTKLQANVFVNRNDDDLADRLNYRYTVAILITFAVVVSHRQFSESVIKCWVPAFFTSNYEQYANQVCWISNTYYVNSTQTVPKEDAVKKSTEIKYYQWIPFILLIQALFLYIPRILWRLLTARAGLDMRDLVEAAHSYKSVEKFDNKKKIMEYIVQNIDQYASNPRRVTRKDSIFQKIKYFGESLFCGSGIYLGNYLVTTYFFIKLAYLINSIMQFYLMNEFLGKQFHQLGVDILRYLTNTYSFENSLESVYFPKVVMCDFLIREFGHPNFSHKYSIQCVLPINLYNQQIFTVLWFWFLILLFMNIWALLQWINRMMPQQRRRYVNKRLNLLKYFEDLTASTGVIKTKGLVFKQHKAVSLEAKRQKRKFIDNYLKFDGVFILRMISMLTSELVGTEVLHELWNKRAVYEKLETEDGYNGRKDLQTNKFNNDNNDTSKYKGTAYKGITKRVPTKLEMKKKSISDSKMRREIDSPKPIYKQSISVPAILGPKTVEDQIIKPKENKFKKLIQKNFMTKPAPVHFKLTTGSSLAPTVNRVKLHRQSISMARKSVELESNSLSIGSLRSSAANQNGDTKSKSKRVVFASSVTNTIDNSTLCRNEKRLFDFDDGKLTEKNEIDFDDGKINEKDKLNFDDDRLIEKNEFNFDVDKSDL